MEKKYNKTGQYPKTDIVGETFGRLIVLEWRGRNKWKNNMWLCECLCGNKTIVRESSLKSEVTKSCGCLQIATATKHGYATKTKRGYSLYTKFENMKNRCYNIDDKNYKDYGGRGIKICSEWLNSLDAFIEWGFKNGYEKGLTIERIDNDGGYTPENCCFIDQIGQTNNRRSNHLLTYNGKTQSMAQWAREFSLKYHVLKNRIRRGWSIGDALLKPVDTKRRRESI